MLGTAIIVFREVLEAALIIGIVLAATRGVAKRGRWVLGGVGAGVVMASVVAIFAGFIADAAEGLGQEFFNAGVLIAAALMLAWHNIWMAEHARELIGRMNSVGTSVAQGELPMRALTFVVCLAVLREGSEIVLFLYGMAASSQGISQMVLGSGFGLFGGAIMGAVLYLGLLRIPTRHLFTVTGWLILLLAAAMASEAARFLVQADVLPPLSAGPVWDSSALLSDHSIAGQTLHALIGYTPRPLGIQLIVYLTTIIVIGGLMLRISSAPKAVAAALLISISFMGADMLTSSPAHAGDKVYSPIVHKGELELEFTGHRDNGGDQSHKWEIGYGLTERWASAVFLETERERGGEGLEIEALAWENIVQLTEQGQYWLDLGVYIEYEGSLKNGGHDKLETMVLLEKQLGQFVHRANIIFEKEVSGANKDGWELGYAWQSKYRFVRGFEFGLEGFGEFGEIRDFEPAREQEHRMGPVATGVFPISKKWNLKYEAGFQIGLTHESPDNRVKAIIELETYF